MNVEFEDSSSVTLQRQIADLELLENRIWWARGLTLFGGLVCTYWLIHRVYASQGLAAAVLAVIGMSMVYTFGVPAMFVVAATVLCFGYRCVGTWLPILSYVLGLLLLYVDVRRGWLRRRVDPYRLGGGL